MKHIFIYIMNLILSKFMKLDICMVDLCFIVKKQKQKHFFGAQTHAGHDTYIFSFNISKDSPEAGSPIHNT